MKKIIFILLVVILMPVTSYADDYQFYFFGVNANIINKKNWKQVSIGAITAIATHTCGHLLYGKINNNDVTFTSLNREVIHNASQSDRENFSRAGFVAQSLVGLALTSFEVSRNWSFTRGYVVAAALDTLSYPIRNNNSADLKYMGVGGEFAVYSLISLHNLLRVDLTQ